MRLNEMLNGINTLPERLKKFRSAAGMSQQELADKSGVSKNHVSSIERGHTAVTMETIVRLAWALDCSIGMLAEGQESQRFDVQINGVTYAPAEPE
ncbi:helix-turn-helix domain-containing protein [Vibrio harveyi]|uniref:helix-turn-helix domain-containing protein n=1 Tax=Vibrio harveyi TaxID=669 RepID=UPI0018F275E4|nr:helix-turn-helix transcriptional regulator [Vibrio harveyi]